MQDCRIGIIGCGFIAETHARALETLEGQVVAVCDTDLKRGKMLGDKFGARYYQDYRDILDDKEVTAVIIALPTHLHYECALASIKSGKHIFCEKPMTTTPRDSEELVRQAYKSGIIFQIGYMKRFNRGYRKVKELLGTLGQPSVINICSTEPISITEAKQSLERKPPEARRGYLFDTGSHLIDIMRFLFGEPKSVLASRLMFDSIGRDCITVCFFELVSGTPVTFEIICAGMAGRGYTQARESLKEILEIYGLDYRIKLNNPWWDDILPPKVILEQEDIQEFMLDDSNQYIEEIKTFISGVEQNKSLGPTVVDGYRTDYIMHSIYESYYTGEKIEIEVSFNK